jgi:dTDP-4-dehydrorhamnose reductase
MSKVPKKLLIFGAYGNLGKIISKDLARKFQILRVGRGLGSQISIKKYTNIPNIIKKNSPDIIINLIAETNVDDCEKNKKKAKVSNIETVKKIVEGIEKIDKIIKFIHFSTDQVYSKKKVANREKDANPINYYAKTKFHSEMVALKCEAIVIRVNFIGKQSIKKKRSLTDWVYYNIKENNRMYGFKNIFFNPVHTSTISKILVKIINKKKMTGIFNLGSRSYISKSNFIKIFLNKSNKLNLLRAIDYKRNNSLAIRPLNMVMNCKKIEKKLSIEMPTIKKEINKSLKEYFR